ncbi:MAG: hypothetical protein AMXMBFR84_38830 [Candidatus Hydrogenedentota bacterium]
MRPFFAFIMLCATAQAQERPDYLKQPAIAWADEVTVPNGAYRHSSNPALVTLPDASYLCVWSTGEGGRGTIVASTLANKNASWTPAVLVAQGGSGPAPLVRADGSIVVYMTSGGKVTSVVSTDGGKTWGEPANAIGESGLKTRGMPLRTTSGAVLLPIEDTRGRSSRVAYSTDDGTTFALSEPLSCEGGNGGPVLAQRADGSIVCFMQTHSKRYKAWRSESGDDGKTWSAPVEIEVPNSNSPIAAAALPSGNILLALDPAPEGEGRRLALWLSTNAGDGWHVFRDIERGDTSNADPNLAVTPQGEVHVVYARPDGGVKHQAFNERWIWDDALIHTPYELANTIPPIRNTDDPRAMEPDREVPPVEDVPFGEHVKAVLTEAEAIEAESLFKAPDAGGVTLDPPVAAEAITSIARIGDKVWVGTLKGLYAGTGNSAARHDDYGVDGPLSSRITGLAADSKGVLWIGTAAGISCFNPDGTWTAIRGKQGLPVEDVTALAIDSLDNVWIGTSHGAALHKPYAEGRQWFYRAGKRYLNGDRVQAIAFKDSPMPVYFKTEAGVTRLDEIPRTLEQKAEIMEARLNRFNRRLGLVSACTLDSADNPTSSIIIDDDNDGLWTSYHVVATSLAYAETGNEKYLESAKTGMHAMVMLQNASGIPGLVARSVLPVEEGIKKREQSLRSRSKTGREQWRPTPDGTMYWKSDTSSDEIDGHYFAFYAYWRHVAQFIPEERALIEKQVRDVTDYILDNNYQLIDWDGEVTLWGYWNPERLNDTPLEWGANGLNSLEILSFIKTAHYITGDPKYKVQYEKLIGEHDYLSNVQLQKKIFPDTNNHSDNQLGYVAWYPILQLEYDPAARDVLHRAVRRHYQIVETEHSSFFDFATATIDRQYVDIESAAQTLRDIPTDRRQWAMMNSHRADVAFQDRLNRHDDPVLTRVLPGDERNFTRWNTDPFMPNGGDGVRQRVAGIPAAPHNQRTFGPDLSGEGRTEVDGGSWLLAYWIARYHDLIAAPAETVDKP